jgi:hypothetical protein
MQGAKQFNDFVTFVCGMGSNAHLFKITLYDKKTLLIVIYNQDERIIHLELLP